MVENTKAKKITPKAILIGLFVVVFLFSTGSMIMMKSVYDDHFPRVDKPKYTGYLTYEDVTNYESTKVNFLSGKNTLTGYLFGGENDRGLVVIAHGLGYRAEQYLAETLYFVDHGWRVLVYDCTGTGESEGKNTKGLPQSLLDLEAALDYVERDPSLNDLPILLYGHSWGGYAVTAILNYDYEIEAVASVAGFSSPDELLTEEMVRLLGGIGYLEVPFGWMYQRMLFGSTAGMTAVDGINRSDTPVMIIHGTADESIFYDGASIISHQGDITNPNVVYKTCSTPGQNGHNDLFESVAAHEYIDEVNLVYDELIAQYGTNIPDEVKAEFYANVDRFHTSELDADFMNEVNDFFEVALSQ